MTDIPVLFRDEHIIVVDKPVDLPVHKNDFMPNDAPYLTKEIGNLTGKWIYNVHRLDAKTSGVIVLAFSSESAHDLTQQFEQKRVEKTYQAIVQGKPGEGCFDSKVVVKKKSKFKKPAVTNYRTLKTIPTFISYKEKENVELSWVEVFPETGRWHQIRQHFARNRFDILGDKHHGDFTLNKIVAEKTGIDRLFLHASKIKFFHPVLKHEIEIKAEVPSEFETIINFNFTTST